MKGSKALTSVRKDAAIIGTADARFASAIEAIYDAAPDPDLWPKALQSIADCFDDVGALMMWRRDDGGFGTVVSPSLVAAQEDYEQNEWYLRDLPAQRNIELGIWLRKDAVTDLDGISDEEMQTHPFYRDFCARHGLRWRAAIGVSPDPHISVWIAIQRGPHKQPHSKAELAVAMRLARHVEKSLRLGIRLLDAELSRHGLGGALARVGIGVFALDALGRVVFSNPVAKCLVGEHIEIVGSRLRLGSRAERPAFDAAIARMLRGDPADLAIDDPKPLLIQRSAPARALAVHLLPIAQREGPAEQFLTRTRGIVLVIDPKPNEPADPAVVRDILGVTLGEARLAALIAAGISPRDASVRLGISEGTARTVLKRVFGKVGVSRQSELAALLARMVLSAPSH